MKYNARNQSLLPVVGRRIRIATTYHETCGVITKQEVKLVDTDWRSSIYLTEDNGECNRYDLAAISWEYEDSTLLPCGYHFPCPCDP